MKKELEEKLVKNFPVFYRDAYGDMRQTCMAFGVECGEGWFNLLYEVSAKLEAIAAKDELPKPQSWFQKAGLKVIDAMAKVRLPSKKPSGPFHKSAWNLALIIPANIYCYFIPEEDSRLKATQIKEKFGELRIYTNYCSPDIDKIVNDAEEKSRITCETCGRDGSTRNHNYWYVTLCDEHFDEYKQKRS